MQANKRKQYLQIIKNAGHLADVVEQAIKQAPNKLKSSGNVWHSLSLGNFGEGSAVALIPANVVKPDGSVDFVFSFKAIGVGDKGTASKAGVNAVFITCYVSEAGSAKHTNLFGNSSFVTTSVSKVIADLQKSYPDKKLKPGKVALTSWSGGYGPIREILSSRGTLLNNGIDINSVVLSDGLHASNDPKKAQEQLKPFIEFAQEAAKDPSKTFTTITTGVDPGSYLSSTKASKIVSDAVGAQSNNWNGNGPAPEASHNIGGFNHIELYKPGNISEKEMKKQHAQAFQWAFGTKGNLAKLIGWK